MLTKFLGVEDSKYAHEVMHILMQALIHRVYVPGCKFEIMVCLVGGQGAGKSTFFRFLAINDDWFSDDLKRLDDEKVFRKLQGHWLIEMSEMLATATARSIEDIKSFLSRQKDSYKIPYETHPEDRARQCVFVGTSNNLNFLPLDRSGNRRFAPVKVNPERVDKHILEDEEESREYILQAWAEAMEEYKNSEKHTLKFTKETEEYLKDLQTEFMPEDTKVGVVQEWLDMTKNEYVCTNMIFSEALGRDGEPKNYEAREINEIKIAEEITGKSAPTARRCTMVNCIRLEESKMASLQCSKCGEGIHYHSLPQDIEYIYFSKMTWESICSTRFDKNNKVMDESGVYPKLYRSSTIENDYPEQFVKIWKCPTCGTLHVFSAEGSVKNVFIKDNSTDTYDYIEEGVMFGDYLWCDITDQDISNDRLLSIKPSFYVRISSDYLVISETLDFSKPECYRLYLPGWMKE